NDKIVVELSNKQTKTIEEKEMVGENYNEKGGNKGKDGNGGIIAAIM
ncbi:10400_t:CDS:2, partial [Ambispora leptoticha]